jgi:hypothetical protein
MNSNTKARKFTPIHLLQSFRAQKSVNDERELQCRVDQISPMNSSSGCGLFGGQDHDYHHWTMMDDFATSKSAR